MSGTVPLSDKLVFFVGLNTGFVTNGEPDERYIDFYRSRSSKELYCVIVGNVVIPGGHASNTSTPTISNSRIWTDVATEISARETLPGIQLATVWEGYHGSRNFRSSDGHKTIAQAKELVRSMSPKDLEQVLDSFEAGAEISWSHGFRHVQIHAAHGYLLSLLVDHRICPYADKVLNRLSLLARNCSDQGIETSIRISLRTGDHSFDDSGRDDFHAAIAMLPFDFIDVSSGFYNIDKQLIYPARPDTLVNRRKETIYLAENFPGRRFIFSGRALMGHNTNLPANVHIGVCRDLIANPRYLTERRNGCTNSGKCHYFSRGEMHISCPRWPHTGGAPFVRVPES